MAVADPLKQARVEATLEVALAMLEGAREALKRHGDDPRSDTILLAGFALAADKVGSPGFNKRLRALLEDS